MNIFSRLQKNHSAMLESMENLYQCHFYEQENRLVCLHNLKNEQRNQIRLEESVFYALLKAENEIHPEIIEAFNEHHIMGILLHELEEALMDKEAWNKKLTDFKQLLEMHIDKEARIFTRAYPPAVQDEMTQLLEKMATEEARYPLVSVA